MPGVAFQENRLNQGRRCQFDKGDDPDIYKNKVQGVNFMLIRRCPLIILICVSLFFSMASAGEHPADHPAGAKSNVTTSMLSDAIERYVEKASESGDGYLTVRDDRDGRMLSLTLKKIHKDRLSALADGIYFACVDFTSRDGKEYDIDFFMKDSPEGLKFMEMTVHKEEGKARYNWHKKGDFWVKQKAD